MIIKPETEQALLRMFRNEMTPQDATVIGHFYIDLARRNAMMAQLTIDSQKAGRL
jgi:hypothetical protein